MIGQTISHYRILEKLGEGGMGIVYKAHDSKLNRIVALKFLPHYLKTSDTDQSRFLQEARAAASLNHPNICVVHSIEDADEQQFLVMEYVDGPTLRQKIGAGPLPLNNAINYAIQIGEALQEAHGKGIVHRDIKADNIMLNSKNQIKVMDFGLAKLKGSLKLTRASSTVGTLAYMAPEQLQRGEVDVRSDIFAFGVLLFEMLTGRLPFRGEHEAAMMYSILNEDPEPVQSLRPDVSPEIVHILDRALEKDPNERYQTVLDMLIDVRRLKRDSTKVSRTSLPVVSPATLDAHAPVPPQQPEPAKSTTVVINLPRFSKRTMRYLTAALGVILLAAAAWWMLTQESEKGERIPVAVADFANETDEKELNGLGGMLITSLEQSRHLAVLSRARMFDVLKKLGRGTEDRIDESLGREICKEAHVNALIIASIRQFDQLYTIDLKVLDPSRNEYIFSAKEEGKGKASVPSMIDRLAEKTRVGLKENESQVRTMTKKVSEVTTSNLEAYQHFFQGEQLINRLKFAEAQEEFKKATALDSTFGLAYYRLAYAADWTSPELSKEPLRKALNLIDRIPEKERYLLRALNAQANEGYGQGIVILREMEKIYPDDKEMLYNIGDWSFHEGQMADAAAYLERVLVLDPTFDRALQHATWTYRDLGQFGKMLEMAKRYVAVTGSVESYSLLGRAYALQGNYDEGVKTLQQARNLFPKSYGVTAALGDVLSLKGEHTKAESELRSLTELEQVEARRLGYNQLAAFYPYLGKYKEAYRQFDKVIEMYWQANDTGSAARAIVHKALFMVFGGQDRESAFRFVEKTFPYQAKIHDLNYWGFLGEFYCFRGNAAIVETLSVQKFKQIKWVRPFFRSLFLSVNHDCAKAEADTETLARIGFGSLKMFLLYYRAQCQYDEGNFGKAAEYLSLMQSFLDNGAGFRAVFYPKSLYLLGATNEKKGNRKLAIESYEKFLRLWKDADKDLPELSDAKSRLAKLQRLTSK